LRRVHVLVEGQTEEAFVGRTLRRHLLDRELYVEPKLIMTRRVLAGPDRKGGLSSWRQMERDLRLLLAAGCRHDRRVSECGAPELVNDGVRTAPSRRIQAALPTYRKTLDGPAVLEEIGLAGIRSACPHFDEWVTWLESLPR
jgi:hypothetical protein